MTMRGGIWPILTTVPDPQQPGGVRRARSARPDAAPACALSRRDSSTTIGTPILQGRDVSDDRYARHAVRGGGQPIVRAASTFPVRIRSASSSRSASAVRTIVGVVGDIRVRGLERESEPQVYLPAAQQRDGMLGFYAPQDLVIRATRAGVDADPGGAVDHQEGRSAAADHQRADARGRRRRRDRAARGPAARARRLRGGGVPARRHRHPRPAGVHGVGARRARSACASRSAPGRATSCGWSSAAARCSAASA